MSNIFLNTTIESKSSFYIVDTTMQPAFCRSFIILSSTFYLNRFFECVPISITELFFNNIFREMISTWDTVSLFGDRLLFSDHIQQKLLLAATSYFDKPTFSPTQIKQ